ncbi:MAG: Uncharacterized protein FD138_375 [Planctomycetota bacterium]|nr:MAG: Uncharacterized protein FD138_375 [Planctomycetota bacterium]
MRNLKTVAAASALLGGIATFLLGTWRPQSLERELVRNAPARLPHFDARPIPQRRHLSLHPVENTHAGQTELVSYSDAALVTATAPALLSQVTASPASTMAKAPTIEGLYKEKSTDAAKKITVAEPQTNVSKLFANILFAEADDKVPKGVLTLRIGKSGSVRETSVNIAANSKKTQLLEFDVSLLEMAQAEDIVVLWDPEDTSLPAEARSLLSEPVKAWIDNVPPRILAVRLVGETGGVGVLEIQFANNDLQKTTITASSEPNKGSLWVQRTGGQHDFATPHSGITLLDRTDDSFVVRLNLGSLVTDLYQVTASDVIKDRHGNVLAEPRKFTFNSMPEAGGGPHVPFPEYVRRKERQPQDIFNPGDKVETRVARLYYIRDAHRVAQIINRNVKQYNQSGVERAKLDAKSARETAEQATRDRQNKERDSIRAAESNRQLERELAGARQQLEEMRAVMSQRDLNTNQGKQKEKDVTVAANQRIVADKNAEVDAVQKSLKALVSQISPQQQASDDAELELQDLQYRIEHPTGLNDTQKNELEIKKKAAEEKKALADNKLATLKARKTTLTTQLTEARTALQTAQTELAKAEQLSPLTLTASSTEPLLAAVRNAASKVAELERAVADKRQIENAKREQSEQAQELEDRARENQFRAEVAASTEDPDTYVPGDVKSNDPVTQVSVSVIGEGVLQLRGPIRGINKIRTMINQIDSPLGQVKVGIFTVQVNGEHGDRMEKVATRIEGHIDLSRFLTNQSLGYLRRAIQEVAGAVVANVDAQLPDQHRQIDRDRKYLYAFFGRDFIDELYEMDSEFLHTENKLLSLHGMDTVSQSQACFIMSLAKNDVRQQILDRFRCLVECDLPQAEWDYRKTSSLLPCKLNSQKEVFRNACEKYKFRNVHGFFEAMVYGPDTMTPMQREFIRLAQIFKSQLVAEMELKQRVIERGLIEDSANDELAKAQALESVRQAALQRVQSSYRLLVETQDKSKQVKDELEQLQAKIKLGTDDAVKLSALLGRLNVKLGGKTTVAQLALKSLPPLADQLPINADENNPDQDLERLRYAALVEAQNSELLHPLTKEQIRKAWEKFVSTHEITKSLVTTTFGKTMTIAESIQEDVDNAAFQMKLLDRLVAGIDDPKTPRQAVEAIWRDLKKDWESYNGRFPICLERLRDLSKSLYGLYAEPERQIALSESIARRVRRDIDHRKLLEILIDEQEEKYIELVEGTRSHIAQIDNYLKRLAIALEDDFKVQFYDPGFAGVRAASREWDVNLGQVERTTILTNNRQFAKVSPQATMEFDLPKRAPMIVEGMNGARALVQEYGTLLQDPTFLSLSGMMSGAPVSAMSGGTGTPVPGLPNQGLRMASVRTVLPGQSTDASEQLMSQTGGPDRKFGAALEGLIPDPAVYKFETGTGFEIRPVIQPDGHSVIYDFDYMYTTNVREPVRPDEKHLGRVKRHFIHTQVQTSSFELREISRYQVALKASRTSRGVPLLEDIPGAGVLFRPLPSDESSLQQNIILAQSTVYPTLFDLMGLRWSKYVVDLDHLNLRDLEHVTRGREQSIHDFTFDEASKRVDEFLDVQGKHDEHLRPDLYHQQRVPSPNHPGGHQYQPNPAMSDPRNRGFTIPDRRPEEFRQPSYDALRRNPIEHDLQQVPTPGGHPEDLRLVPPEPETVPLQESATRSKTRTPGSIGSPKTSEALPQSKAAKESIQPASYERSGTVPKVLPDAAGRSQVTSTVIETKSSTVPKKKSWIGKTASSRACSSRSRSSAVLNSLRASFNSSVAFCSISRSIAVAIWGSFAALRAASFVSAVNFKRAAFVLTSPLSRCISEVACSTTFVCWAMD